ncbi:MAG: GWxTD domain-containing protein, partial [Candidatus Aminicenantes bacterium]|nr:GWxTD domain-containing protein [Candidatus Aminicenantes bacterium]
MKIRFIAVVVLCSFLVPLYGQGKAVIGLPERFKKWLDEEVVYIITPKEREVFLKLQTEKEREIFIEAFWKQRDPTPGTPVNEFREEHYRRIQYANKIYGRSTPLPGWRTDRGRIYIILGEPKSIEQYSNVQNVFPAEIWFYQPDTATGLPPAFNVVFFKENGIGDYILYSPTQHGPKALIADVMGDYAGDRTAYDDRTAYEELRKLEPNLARQTLSLIPGERVNPGSLSLASNTLISNIYALPRKMVKDSYADAILKYKDFVDVEYTANYIDSDGQVWVACDPSGFFEVHYSIEPGKISVEEAGDRYAVRFELTGRVTDPEGKTVLQFDKAFPFSFDKNEVRGKGPSARTFSLQDVFPLIAGRYAFDLLLKNTASREFSSFAAKIVIPGDLSAPALGPLELAYGMERTSPAGERGPFALGGSQILSSSRKTFASQDTLHIIFQVLGLTEALRTGGRARFLFFKEDKEFTSSEKRLGEYSPGAFFAEEQPLKTFAPGYYKVKVSLLDAAGKELDSKSGDFELSALPSVPRPMIVANVTKSFERADYLYATGLELMNAGSFKEAAERLAEAWSLKPERSE